MRDRAIALAIAGLVVHALLVTGALVAVPAGLRVALAFGALVLVPGLAWLRMLDLPPAGGWLAAGWALGFGVAWNGLEVLVAHAFGTPFLVLVRGAIVTHGVLLAIALRVRPSRGASAPERRLAAPALVAIGVAAALAAWHGSSLGPPLSFYSDSPDHVATIRRMMETGDPFPENAFYRDAGRLGVDPRKALWHPQVATIASLAAVDPVVAWKRLAGVLAALYVLNAAALGVVIGGGLAAAVAAWGLLLAYGGSLAMPPLREAVFATKLADQLALATTVATLADLGRRTGRSRVAAVGLALGAVACHLFAAIHLAVALGAFGIAMVVRERGFGTNARRLLGTGVAMALACLPYLLWRGLGSYAPANVIHTEPQGLLTLWDGTRVVSMGVLWDWMGRLWLLVPFSWPWLARAGRTNDAALSLFASSVAVAVVLFVPPVVGWLEPRVGYLLLRVVWIVPLAGILAWALPALLRAARERTGRARLAPAIGLAGMAWLVAPAVLDAAQVLRDPPGPSRTELANSPLRWRDALEWMERSLPPGQVVLADPATSYGIPMLTRHYVVTLVDQHSSPNDSLALRRLLDARDALDPYADWSRTREVVDRYGVDVIALNGRFESPPALDYWTARPEWYAAARARLDAEPTVFRRLWDRDRFVVYRVDRAALAALHDPPRARAFVEGATPGRGPIARRIAPDVPAFVDLRTSDRVLAPGDTLRAVARWRATERLAPGSYHVAVRFDRERPWSAWAPRLMGKPLRKLVERVRGERYRFRYDHLPAGGAYGVDLWRRDEIVRDSFDVPIPADAAEGVYTVRVRMLRSPHYPNYRLSDYFLDDDYYSGVEAGRLAVSRAPAATVLPARSGGH